MSRCDDPTCWKTPPSRDDHTDREVVRVILAADHHALHCEGRGLDPMASLEQCPFRAWHDTREPR